MDAPDEDDGDKNRVVPLGDLIHPAPPFDVATPFTLRRPAIPFDGSQKLVLDVRRKPPGSSNENQRLSCPQSFPHPPPRDDRVPQSMGFSVFTQNFDPE